VKKRIKVQLYFLPHNNIFLMTFLVYLGCSTTAYEYFKYHMAGSVETFVDTMGA
jgi:hypothetical protein